MNYGRLWLRELPVFSYQIVRVSTTDMTHHPSLITIQQYHFSQLRLDRSVCKI